VLLDRQAGGNLASEIAERLEIDGDRISDLHLWRVGPGHNAAIISLVTHAPQPPGSYKSRLAELPGLSHVTVEIERCTHKAA
jgi:Co/Zn/Cd efflux system component